MISATGAPVFSRNFFKATICGFSNCTRMRVFGMLYLLISHDTLRCQAQNAWSMRMGESNWTMIRFRVICGRFEVSFQVIRAIDKILR